MQLQPRVQDTASCALKMGKLPGADGILVYLLKHGGDEIMNIPMGIWKCICQNENLVRSVNILIGNIGTPVPKKGDFCLIDNYRTITLKRRFRLFGLVVNAK